MIYYSGHGAIVESTEATASQLNVLRPRRHQFLIPMDYDETTNDEFRGLLDVEVDF